MQERESVLSIPHIVKKIGSSEAYVRERNNADNEHLSDSVRKRRSIKLAATALSERKPSGYLTAEGHAMNLTAHIAEYSSSLNELRKLEDEHAPRKEKLPALRNIAGFNHALREMVDSNPSLRVSDVKNFILTMNHSINGPESGGPMFEDKVRNTITGMRHEIAVEQMTGFMPGVETLEATVEEDLQGVDLKVSINGSPYAAIDVKASHATAEHARQKARARGFDDSHIVWSHANEEDFNGSFRLPLEVAKHNAQALYEDLDNAVWAAQYSSRRRNRAA